MLEILLKEMKKGYLQQITFFRAMKSYLIFNFCH